MDFLQAGGGEAGVARRWTSDDLARSSQTKRPATRSGVCFRQSFNVRLPALAAYHDSKLFRAFSHSFNGLLGPPFCFGHGHDPSSRSLLGQNWEAKTSHSHSVGSVSLFLCNQRNSRTAISSCAAAALPDGRRSFFLGSFFLGDP